MRAYDPLPDFNCNDPAPFPIPRRPAPLWWRAIVAFGWSILICGVAASFFGMAGLALLTWLSS